MTCDIRSDWANVPKAVRRLTTTEATNREPQREWRPGHQTRPRLQTLTVLPQNKIMAVASPFFQPNRPPKHHEKRGIDRKHDHMLKTLR